MAIGIKIDLGPLIGKLDKVLSITGDMKPILELAGLEAQQMIIELFQQQGSPAWEPLTEYTKANRRGDGDSSKILQDEGRLFNSITTADGVGDNVYDLQSNSLTYGSNLVYAAIHQFGWPSGGKHPPPTLPARPYLPNREELIANLTISIHDYVKDHLS